MSNRDMADEIFEALERYREENDLERTMSGQLRALANDAVKQGGLAESAIADRLPRLYKEHARGVSLVINAQLAPTVQSDGLGELTQDVASDGASRSSAESDASAVPEQTKWKDGTIGASPAHSAAESNSLDTSQTAGEFRPTYEMARAGFVRTDRSREHEASRRLRVSLYDRGFLLEWDPTAGEEVLYRVTRTGSRVELPEWGEDTATSTNTRLIDAAVPDWASIHYQVWAHVGDATLAPSFAQPVLLAEAAVVVPPQDVLINADQGRVFGTWRGSSHAGRVHVYRKPLAGSSGAPTDPQFRIQASRANLEGFVDTDVEGGKRYLYSVALEIMENGVGEMSPFVENVVEVPMRVEPVRDFEVIERTNEEGHVVLDLRWAPPPGASRVEIYINDTPPEDGLSHEAHPMKVFSQLGLGERLNYPVRDWVGDKKQIPDVLWQDGWSRMHFTAVSILGDKVHPSETITMVASQIQITEATLHQRVSHQVITLTWPQEFVSNGSGSDGYAFQNVHLFRLRVGADVNGAIQGQPYDTIAASAYRQSGGMRVALGSEPCDIALVPVSRQGGQNFFGRPFVLNYQGLRTLEYRVMLSPVMNPFAKTVKVMIRLRAPEPMNDSPALVLLHNPDRLPLDPRDGREMAVAVKGDQETVLNRFMEPDEVGSEWTETVWVSEVPRTGYVRLFANLRPAQLANFAVIDPPVKSLRTG